MQFGRRASEFSEAQIVRSEREVEEGVAPNTSGLRNDKWEDGREAESMGLLRCS